MEINLIKVLGAAILLSCLAACRHSAIDRQISATSTKIIEAIRSGDSVKFEALIDQLGMLDREVIPHDIALLQEEIQKYHPQENPPIEITHLFNMNGQMLVKVHIFKDSLNGLVRGDLRLLFGPTNFAPLSKITGYEMSGTDKFDSTHYHTYSYWHPAKNK